MARGRKKKIKLRIGSSAKGSVLSIILMVVSFLALVSLFQPDSVAGGLIYNIFGWSAVLIPPFFFVFGLICLRKIEFRFVDLRVLLGLVLLGISLSVTLALAFSAASGGILGTAVGNVLAGVLSAPGAITLGIGGIAVSGVVILNKGVDGAIAAVLGSLGRVADIFKREPKVEVTEDSQDTETAEEISVNGDTEPRIEEPATRTDTAKEFEVINPLHDADSVSRGADAAISGATDNVDRGEFFKVIPPQAEPSDVRTTPDKPSTGKDARDDSPSEIGLEKVWQYPTLDLLEDPVNIEADRGDVNTRSKVIIKTLESFGIKAHIKEINKGPAVTQYALETAQGTKINKINNLQSDLAMALASPTGTVRIEAPIPGKALIGVEVPNFTPSIVTLKSMLRNDAVKHSKSKLTVVLGKNVSGKIIIGDITKMPHALIAGATGSGKSILVHSFISTLLFRCSPDECKFIMVDPKRVELKKYENIPHLLSPVIVDPERALPAFKWTVAEMSKRYKLFEQSGVRDIQDYNNKSGFQALPYIIIVVDEFADLMAASSAEVEKTVCRIAQMSRAVGIHLVLATQRPSVDVLTGLIKANIPTRIALNVSSQTDSRVIIDQVGAEKLLGRGDMLYVPPDSSKSTRVQGILVTDREINRLVDFLRSQNVEPDYKEGITDYTEKRIEGGGEYNDSYFPEAVEIVCREERASATLLQRRLSVGYSRAARILDELEAKGIVSPQERRKPREVLVRDPRKILGENYEESG